MTGQYVAIGIAHQYYQPENDQTRRAECVAVIFLRLIFPCFDSLFGV